MGHVDAWGPPRLLPAVPARGNSDVPLSLLTPGVPPPQSRSRREEPLPEGRAPRGSGDPAPAPGEPVRMTQPLLDPEPNPRRNYDL